MRCASASALAFAALLAAGTALADFKAAEVQPRFAGSTLELGGGFELALTPKVEEALAKGIPLEIVVEARLYRERSLLWNARVGQWRLRREIRYHALSGQYLVRALGSAPESQESFTTLPEALRALGTLGEVKLVLAEAPAPEAIYVVRLRASLDIEALPAPLRPVAYTSLDWHLDSGWNLWKVAR